MKVSAKVQPDLELKYHGCEAGLNAAAHWGSYGNTTAPGPWTFLGANATLGLNIDEYGR